MFQFCCLILIEAAPPLDTVDTATEGLLDTVVTTEAALDDDVTTAIPDNDEIKKPTTKEKNDNEAFERLSKHYHNDRTEVNIDNATHEENTMIAEHKASTEVLLTGKERRGLVSHLTDLELASGTNLVLTPRQKLALKQELELRRKGLSPWSDPTPWQRLSRSEQNLFNDKYLSLPPELQVYRL